MVNLLSEISCKPAKKQKSKPYTTSNDQNVGTPPNFLKRSASDATELSTFIHPDKIKPKIAKVDLCPNDLKLTVKLRDKNSNTMRNPTSILLEQAQKDKVTPPKVEITATGPYHYPTISFRGKVLKIERGFKKKDNAKHFAAVQMLMKVYGVWHDWKPTGVDLDVDAIETVDTDCMIVKFFKKISICSTI